MAFNLAKKYENMNNNNQNGFLEVFGKINNTDIIFKHKPRGIYDRETFFI